MPDNLHQVSIPLFPNIPILKVNVKVKVKMNVKVI